MIRWLAAKFKNAKKNQDFHVIFFYGGGRTRSFHFKLATMVFAGLFFLGLSTWSVTSFVLVTNLQGQLNVADGRIRSAFAKLFELQVMQEKSFQKIAVQKQPKNPAAAIAALEAEKNKLNSAPQLTFQNTNLMVSNIRLQNAGFNPKLKFDIQNLAQNNKSEGFMWAVVGYDTESGEHKKLIIPEGVEIDNQGKLINIKAAYRFNIRNFKSRDFAISGNVAPENIKSVTYYISDLAGKKIESQSTGIFSEPNP